MSKHKSQYHKLTKQQQERHFASEHGNGKGSHRREETQTTRDNYNDGYDKIEWGVKKS